MYLTVAEQWRIKLAPNLLQGVNMDSRRVTLNSFRA